MSEQGPRAEALVAMTIGEQAEVANAWETCGQHVQQKAPDEQHLRCENAICLAVHRVCGEFADVVNSQRGANPSTRW